MTRADSKHISSQAWSQALESVDVPKQDLNALIINYLIVEGYPKAALKFAHEAKLNIESLDMDSIQERLAIKLLIYQGQIGSAISKINDLDTDLLESNPKLHFALLRLQLIELIKICHQRDSFEPQDYSAVLEFAAAHLAPRAARTPEFQTDLEQAMALLCFSKDLGRISQLRDLTDSKLRQSVAQEVNEALLHTQGLSGETTLKKLLALWTWASSNLEKHGLEYPRLSKLNVLDLEEKGDWI